jgi:hypothetical protein
MEYGKLKSETEKALQNSSLNHCSFAIALWNRKGEENYFRLLNKTSR